MTDTNVNTPTPDDNGDEKRRIATREWINADGEKVPTGSAEVAGVRYTYLATGQSVEWHFGQNETLDRQFAAMGAVTKLGNVVNTFTHREDYVEGSDPIPVVAQWLKEASDGKWREASDGVARGPKYDKAVLATVIVQLLAGQAAGDYAHYLAKLDDKSYYAKVRANTKVMAAYHQEMAKRGGDEVDIGGIA